MKVLRTPDERFANLADYAYEPNYLEIDGVRIHYVDEGDAQDDPVLLMHGEPTWSYLYRHMISTITENRLRAVAPDLVGFGRSDKPANRRDYTYERLVDWMTKWLDAIELNNITLVCQDWGSLIGLRVLVRRAARFHRVVLTNGGLPTGDHKVSPVFHAWRLFARCSPWFPISRIVAAGCATKMSPRVAAAYDAPFPDRRYKQGARALPRLVPVRADDPGAAANRRAWEILETWDRPFLTAFSDRDPITRGMDGPFLKRVPGARGRHHAVVRGAGHFVQEDRGLELASIVVEFIHNTRH